MPWGGFSRLVWAGLWCSKFSEEGILVVMVVVVVCVHTHVHTRAHTLVWGRSKGCNSISQSSSGWCRPLRMILCGIVPALWIQTYHFIFPNDQRVNLEWDTQINFQSKYQFSEIVCSTQRLWVAHRTWRGIQRTTMCAVSERVKWGSMVGLTSPF